MISRYEGERRVLDMGYAFASGVYLTALLELKIPSLHGLDLAVLSVPGMHRVRADMRPPVPEWLVRPAVLPVHAGTHRLRQHALRAAVPAEGPRRRGSLPGGDGPDPGAVRPRAHLGPLRAPRGAGVDVPVRRRRVGGADQAEPVPDPRAGDVPPQFGRVDPGERPQGHGPAVLRRGGPGRHRCPLRGPGSALTLTRRRAAWRRAGGRTRHRTARSPLCSGPRPAP